MSAIIVDVGARLVRREGSDIHLAPKAFELLLMLVRNRPNAVPHEQLHAALWPGVHVSETSLAALGGSVTASSRTKRTSSPRRWL